MIVIRSVIVRINTLPANIELVRKRRRQQAAAGARHADRSASSEIALRLFIFEILLDKIAHRLDSA